MFVKGLFNKSIQKEFPCSITDQYVVLKPGYRKGLRGTISLVRRKNDGQLFVLKMVKGQEDPNHSFANEMRSMGILQDLGLSKGNTFWAPDGESLLKTYVEGPTLTEVLRQNNNFFSENSVELEALKQLIMKLCKSSCYIGDLNSGNLIFNDQRWFIIDCGIIKYNLSYQERIERYHGRFIHRWQRHLPDDHHAQLINFLKKLFAQMSEMNNNQHHGFSETETI